MEKLLETSLGHWDDTWFSLEGRRLSDEEALKLIKEKCNPYVINKEGVLAYMSEEEYELLKNIKMNSIILKYQSIFLFTWNAINTPLI